MIQAGMTTFAANLQITCKRADLISPLFYIEKEEWI
jgi:hypothetical protein